MLDSAVSSQKAAIELFQTADRMKRSSAFTNRSVIEAMEEMGQEQTEKSADQVDATKALEIAEKAATNAVGEEEEKEEDNNSGSNNSGSNDSGSNDSGSNDSGSNDNQEDMVAARNQYRMNGMKRA